MPAVLRFLPMLSAPYPARSIAAAASHHHTVKRRVHPPFGGIYCVHCGAGRCGCQLRPVVSSGQILRIIVIRRNIEHLRLFCGCFRKRTTFLGLRILRNCGYGAWYACLVTDCRRPYANGVNITGRRGGVPARRISPRRPHEGLTSVRFRRPPAVLSQIPINRAVCSFPE